jgi:NifU-like protein
LSEPDAIGGANVEGQPPEAVVFLKMQKGRIVDAGFQTSGCGYLIACCSALLEMAIGRSKEECGQLGESHLTSHLGGLPLTKEYCAVLAVLALRNALAKLAPCTSNEEKAA